MLHAQAMEIDERLKDPRVIGVAISIVILLLIVSLSALLIGTDGDNDDDEDGDELLDDSTVSFSSHPKLVTAEFTDLSMIDSISKFRSGAGHDFSYDEIFQHDGVYFGATDSSEPDSSMKHYYAPIEAYKGDQSTVPIYAPFDGTITRVSEEVWEDDTSIANKRIEITSTEDPSYIVVIFHVNLDDRYPQSLNDWPAEVWWNHYPDDTSYVSDVVSAGELLGYADMRGDRHNFDVAILHEVSPTEKYWLSMFELMEPWVRDTHYVRGHTGSGVLATDFTFTKSYREANIVEWGAYNEEDWVQFPPSWREATVSNGTEFMSQDCTPLNMGDTIQNIQRISYEDANKSAPKQWSNFTYNEAGQLVFECIGTPTEPHDRLKTYVYDENQLIAESSSSDYDGGVEDWVNWYNTTYTYDSKMRLIEKNRFADGVLVQYVTTTYDDQSHTKSEESCEVGDDCSYHNFTYDSFGKVISETQFSVYTYGNITDEETYHTSSTYDDEGRLATTNSTEIYMETVDGVQTVSSDTFGYTYSYQDTLIWANTTFVENDDDGSADYNCNYSKLYDRNISNPGFLYGPYGPMNQELGTTEAQFFLHAQISRSNECDNGDSSSIEHNFDEDGNMIQSISRTLSSAGRTATSWTNYSYDSEGKLTSLVEQRTINGSVDESPYAYRQSTTVYDTNDPNRIIKTTSSFSHYNYTTDEFETNHTYFTIEDANGNEIESGSYGDGYAYITVRVWA